MSEFSQVAIDAITTNLDDIRRRLSLDIEGDTSVQQNAEGGTVKPEELEKDRIEGGMNTLLYGVPGSGKSWTIVHE